MRNCTEEHKTDKGNLVSGHMVANWISMHDWVGGSLNQSVTDHAQTENCAKEQQVVLRTKRRVEESRMWAGRQKGRTCWVDEAMNHNCS